MMIIWEIILHCVPGFICGDICIGTNQLTDCKCGDDLFTEHDHLLNTRYCCSGNACITEGNTVVCKNATIKSIKEPCYGQCPGAKILVNFIAISSNVCSDDCYEYKSNDENYLYGKVCHSKDQQSDQSFALTHCGDNAQSCSTAKDGGSFKYAQCYSNNMVTRENTLGHR